ncbi:facilitated trehalose transporter Tret1-like isoform X2 [Hyposmocoma kahamanoa]|uniref:facilitated trehalose transporter Tret1-like isoform X2 n=1 Tax=Hyposmocoma kahamanoa TaxID=1477025 RepID=UPI000E6D8046|nr:facilitated trehalose transporter Tret1-like isoform X2 [Hyposmocoma kahamanoa]
MDEKQRNQVSTVGSVRKQILTALLATIPTLTYGIQLGWLSPMRQLLKSPTGPASPPITDGTISWMAAALPLAAILGVPFFSYSSDKFGRKICIIAISLLHSISWTIKLTSVTPTSLIIARAIGGLGTGGCFVVIPVYIKEISQDSIRGALASLTMTMCKVGVIFVYAVGMWSSYKGNQAVFLTIAVLHVIVFCFLPESPNYSLRLGKEKKASRTIAWLRSVPETLVTSELNKLKEEQQQYETASKVSLLSAMRDRTVFSALRMTLTLMAMQTLSGSFALMNFAADVFERVDAQWSPNTLALFMGSLQLAGSFFTTMSIERFGRKIPLACSSLAVSICMISLATCFLVGMTSSWPRVAAVCIAILAYGVGLAPVPMVIMAEVFPFEFEEFAEFCRLKQYNQIRNSYGGVWILFCQI